MMMSVAIPIDAPYSTMGVTSIVRKLKKPAAVVKTQTIIGGPVKIRALRIASLRVLPLSSCDNIAEMRWMA